MNTKYHYKYHQSLPYHSINDQTPTTPFNTSTLQSTATGIATRAILHHSDIESFNKYNYHNYDSLAKRKY